MASTDPHGQTSKDTDRNKIKNLKTTGHAAWYTDYKLISLWCIAGRQQQWPRSAGEVAKFEQTAHTLSFQSNPRILEKPSCRNRRLQLWLYKLFNSTACKHAKRIHCEAWKCRMLTRQAFTAKQEGQKKKRYDKTTQRDSERRTQPALTVRQMWSESAEALVLLFYCDTCSPGLLRLPWRCFTIW